MDKFDKAILNYFIVGGYREIFYEVEMYACDEDAIIVVSDRIKGEAKLKIAIYDDSIIAAIFCDENDFAIDVIERFAELVNLKLIKVNAK